jgi:hypothetical protein
MDAFGYLIDHPVLVANTVFASVDFDMSFLCLTGILTPKKKICLERTKTKIMYHQASIIRPCLKSTNPSHHHSTWIRKLRGRHPYANDNYHEKSHL